VLDKTGTLTTGTLDFTGARTEGMAPAEALALAAALEEVARHPLAERIFREGAGRAQGRPLPEVSERVVHPGLGVAGVWTGRPVLVGRPGWLRGQGVVAHRR